MSDDLILTDEEMVHHAFQWYCDTVVDLLVRTGISEDAALDAFFSSAAVLYSDGIMPEFPGVSATYIEEGRWLVKAKDEDFLGLVLEAISG
jgi:hypothetical protein